MCGVLKSTELHFELCAFALNARSLFNKIRDAAAPPSFEMPFVASLLLLSSIERVSQIAYNKYEIQTDGAGGAIQLLDNEDHNVTNGVTLPAGCDSPCADPEGCSDQCTIEITDRL